jgi:Fe-S cluster biosynthesis and repair protein YggX
MSRMLVQLGQPAPAAKAPVSAAADGPDTGFRCQRPGCMAGSRARQLAKPPMTDEIGQRIHEKVCADCWQLWLRDFSVKVVNELHLDLSSEVGQDEYDRYMREFLGL